MAKELTYRHNGEKGKDMKLTEKINYLLEVKSKYTYHIFTNGNGDMSVEVQLTKDFKKATLHNFALCSMSIEDFEKRMSVEKINQLFLMLRGRISEYGSYFELASDYYGFVEV